MLKPLSEPEMQVMLAEEIARLDDLSRPSWKKHKTKVETVKVASGDSATVELFSVAKAGNEVVVYDHRIDEFGTGVVAEDGVVRKLITYGKQLGWSMRHFPRTYEKPADEE